MGKILFDSHCHITDMTYDGLTEDLMEELAASDLKYIATIAEDFESSLKVVEAAAKYPMCYGAVGWHPHNVKDLDEELLFLTMNLYKKPKIKAIGEIGLDYHHDLSPRDKQRYWFGRQVEEAVKMKAPIVIHDRDANNDVFSILRDFGAFSEERKASFPKRADGTPDARVLLHCYSGSAALAERYVKSGADISMAGPLTFKNARKSVETAESIDLSRLLIETDSPYLTPEPLRGWINKPCYVEHTCRKLAEIKGISYEEAAAATLENACRFYDIKDGR